MVPTEQGIGRDSRALRGRLKDAAPRPGVLNYYYLIPALPTGLDISMASRRVPTDKSPCLFQSQKSPSLATTRHVLDNKARTAQSDAGHFCLNPNNTKTSTNLPVPCRRSHWATASRYQSKEKKTTTLHYTKYQEHYTRSARRPGPRMATQGPSPFSIETIHKHRRHPLLGGSGKGQGQVIIFHPHSPIPLSDDTDLANVSHELYLGCR